MTTDAPVLEERSPETQPETVLESHEEEIHMPPSTIAPLIAGAGVALVVIGMIQPLLLVIGLPLALVGVLRMTRGSDFDMHPAWLGELDIRKFGMWTFIASEVMFFTGLIGMFIFFKVNNAGAFDEAHHVLSLPLATLGTSVLIVSSFAVVMGLEALQSNDRRIFFNWMGLTIFFGATFLSIQAFEWYELMHHDITAETIFGSAFFVTTGFHGLHVLGGVAWLSLLVRRAYKARYTAENSLIIELFGLYWHFVDVVWIVLFTVIYLIN